ncbi:protein sidekick-2 isoform X2 [Lingula anatina]|uniref:Protein sidekick-2 isoform X2 n=1 Tax=Lingula anatina TaxID=7574 RepID=A0A1S3HMS5_LINAN|nr:protein sidekick-2 isoform X2 [Lingula anatina]|eukprot:XP_013386811.1 protein sidekick-2 isoform X2 [Lingula anatina]
MLTRTYFHKFSRWLMVLSVIAGHTIYSGYAQSPPSRFLSSNQQESTEWVGNNKLLMCQATGDPPPLYSWLKNGQFIYRNISRTSIRLTNIQVADAGEYQCLASNPHGAILSSKVQIHVAYLGTFPTRSTSEDVTVSEGSAAIINLPTINSYPAASVQWFEAGILINPASWTRHYVTLKNNLVVTETSQQDAKSFHAVAKNTYLPQEERQTHNFILRVQGTNDRSSISPEIVVPPEDVTVAEGTSLPIKLECVANAKPRNYLTTLWFRKNGNQRTAINHDNNRNILQYNNRTLTIFNPTTQDAGVYQCEAVLTEPGQTHPTAQAEATVTVLGLLRFGNLSPSVLSKDFGETVYILCNYTGNSGATLSWYKNGVDIQTLNNPRFEPQTSGSLKINGLDPDDAGMFQCFASNMANSINFAVWLQVQSSAPVFVRSPRNISIVEGQDARFPCEANGAPKPSVHWTKVLDDGTEQNLTTSGRYQVLERELLIASSESSDTGTYVCWAYNSVGSASASAYLTVTIRTQITQPPQDAAAVLGTTATFQCGVVHDPLVAISVTWYMHINNQRSLIGSDPRFQVANDGSLIIMAVNQVDIGTYECVVTSKGGNDSRTAQLTVIEKPTKPAIIRVAINPTNQKSVDIQWVKPFDGNSPITKYIVQFRILPEGSTLPPSEGWTTADDNVPVPAAPSPIYYTVSGLQPAKVYQFRVSAINRVGEGPYSDPSETVTIPQQPPSSPARGVLGRSKSNDTFFLQWQPPQEDFWNGPLRGFTIRFRLAGYDTNPWNYRNYTIDRPITETTTFYYDVTGPGVFVFQQYDVGVAAFNDKGVGEYSASIQVWTEEGVPRQPPSAFSVQAVNSTSIRAQWDPVGSQFMNGISLGFKLIYRKVNDVREQITNVPIDPTNYYGTQTGYIVNLEKFTEYKVSVLCYTSKGDGPRSSTLNVTTAEDVPDEVGSLIFPVVQHTSIKGQWTRPANINGILQGYVLTHMVKNQTETQVVLNLGPDILEYEIGSLTPETVYTIEVMARSRVGPGPARTADIKSGVPPEPPNAPTNVGVSNILSRSAVIQFEPGYDGKTSITKWIIEAQIRSAVASVNPETPWKNVFNTSAPDAKSFVVHNLRPYTYYRLRIIAQNVAGISAPSDPTRAFQTTQDRPESAPKNVTVRAVNETAIRVSWMPLPSSEWNGAPEGYRIEYKAKNAQTFSMIDINDINMNSYTIVGLEEYTEYQGRMQARNEIDLGPYSDPLAKDKTWESVPSAGPQNVNATAVNSVSIRVVWGDVPMRSQNGLILGYKVQYSSQEEGLSPEMVTVEGNMTKQCVLTGLRKYVMYKIQVLAYTRIGDGVLSNPPKSTRTDEDVPGKPTIIYFPDVTFSTAKVVWAPPLEPNGIITGYRLIYQKKEGGPSQTNYTTAGVNEFTVYQLEREKTYMFTLTAKTRLGWGDSETVEVRTIKDRKKPDAPSTVQVSNSQIKAREVTISWQPGFDWYGPIRNFTIQYQKEGQTWVTVPGLVPHTNTSHTIGGLSPSSRYIFRVAATNDIGTSEFSSPSASILTLEAAPDGAPLNLKVTPYTTTSVKVQWEPPRFDLWNGILQGYVIQYRKYGVWDNWQSENLFSKDLNSISLEGFELFKTYEFRLAATNALGQGPWSPSQIVYMEIVPTASPESLLLEAKSSTAIQVRWRPPPVDSQNGALQGYKIFYWEDGKQAETEKKALVEATANEISLQDLKMYTVYNIRVLAYNPAGDGPNSTIASARTNAGIPGKPGELSFHNISLDSLNVTWTPPEEPNGVIVNYEVVYIGASKTVQVETNSRTTYYFARDLEEGVTYNFSVKAKTDLGYGPSSTKAITTGSQQGELDNQVQHFGSPAAPIDLELDYASTSVTLKWTNGAEGASAIKGYIIQSKAPTEWSWRTILRKNSAGSVAVIPFDNLSPNNIYQFRVIAVNDHGISDPSLPSQPLQTPALSPASAAVEKIYEQWWFLVIVALCGLILIIIVVSLLCCTAKRNKEPLPANMKVMTPVTMPPSEEAHSVVDDDGGFTSFEMRESIRRSKRSVANGKKNNYIRSPPRPSPASVTYSDEESKPPGYDEDGSSTTSGKPSDLDSDSQESDSEPPSEKGSQAAAPQPHQSSSFMTANPYVNDPVRQSWKRQKSNSKAYSYTDSEQESSHYAMSLNGGHIIMNNMAGSRAPLPGFSSFV